MFASSQVFFFLLYSMYRITKAIKQRNLIGKIGKGKPVSIKNKVEWFNFINLGQLFLTMYTIIKDLKILLLLWFQKVIKYY